MCVCAIVSSLCAAPNNSNLANSKIAAIDASFVFVVVVVALVRSLLFAMNLKMKMLKLVFVRLLLLQHFQGQFSRAGQGADKVKIYNYSCYCFAP